MKKITFVIYTLHLILG